MNIKIFLIIFLLTSFIYTDRFIWKNCYKTMKIQECCLQDIDTSSCKTEENVILGHTYSSLCEMEDLITVQDIKSGFNTEIKIDKFYLCLTPDIKTPNLYYSGFWLEDKRIYQFSLSFTFNSTLVKL